ncbi:hypothetical protein, partial [Tannerella forsythia]|uniref:hypothetical protein n=1 Tax=Tannerella forsythia TaxID=28112 RepID=UPI001C8A44A9
TKMVHRTMGFPHKSKPKSSYRVIWDKEAKQGFQSLPTVSQRPDQFRLPEKKREPPPFEAAPFR